MRGDFNPFPNAAEILFEMTFLENNKLFSGSGTQRATEELYQQASSFEWDTDIDAYVRPFEHKDQANAIAREFAKTVENIFFDLNGIWRRPAHCELLNEWYTPLATLWRIPQGPFLLIK